MKFQRSRKIHSGGNCLVLTLLSGRAAFSNWPIIWYETCCGVLLVPEDRIKRFFTLPKRTKLSSNVQVVNRVCYHWPHWWTADKQKTMAIGDCKSDCHTLSLHLNFFVYSFHYQFAKNCSIAGIFLRSLTSYYSIWRLLKSTPYQPGFISHFINFYISIKVPLSYCYLRTMLIWLGQESAPNACVWRLSTSHHSPASQPHFRSLSLYQQCGQCTAVNKTQPLTAVSRPHDVSEKYFNWHSN